MNTQFAQIETVPGPDNAGLESSTSVDIDGQVLQHTHDERRLAYVFAIAERSGLKEPFHVSHMNGRMSRHPRGAECPESIPARVTDVSFRTGSNIAGESLVLYESEGGETFRLVRKSRSIDYRREELESMLRDLVPPEPDSREFLIGQMLAVSDKDLTKKLLDREFELMQETEKIDAVCDPLAGAIIELMARREDSLIEMSLENNGKAAREFLKAFYVHGAPPVWKPLEILRVRGTDFAGVNSLRRTIKELFQTGRENDEIAAVLFMLLTNYVWGKPYRILDVMTHTPLTDDSALNAT